MIVPVGDSLFDAAAAVLDAEEVDEKILATMQFAAAWGRDDLRPVPGVRSVRNGPPGRPKRLRLVAPTEVPRRRLRSRAGAIAFLHALAHIELNAIDLAWDCIQRFRDFPDDYYDDWVAVARDEATHFALLRARLRDLGAEYGDLPAHNGLWEMAEKTAGDPLERMALVPRFLEARGLDVAPGMIERLKRAGDETSAAIVRRILEEEVNHVAAGSRWFRYLCELRGLEAETEFLRLIDTHLTGKILGPFNLTDRVRAGFSPRELAGIRARSPH
jgi:uncharacterized ferritin-like protein (DUF455 family)